MTIVISLLQDCPLLCTLKGRGKAAVKVSQREVVVLIAHLKRKEGSTPDRESVFVIQN